MFELESLRLQYELKKKKKRKRTCVLCFVCLAFKSKQNTSSSGQRGQIIRLESVIEGGRVKRKEEENRGRSV